jgi:adenine-specific DNA-methyltransferase
LSKYSIILDFFAGSGTTMEAVMQLNKGDVGYRQCILITNNEGDICEKTTYKRIKNVINGYGNQEGLHNNNLRYYQTDFISRERTQHNMRALTAAATDLLCIKENLYDEQTTFGRFKLRPNLARYFNDGTRHMLIIYHEELVDEIVEEIKRLKTEGQWPAALLTIYIFSPGRYAFDDNFFEVQDSVQLIALPAAIYDAYQRVLPKQKEHLLDEAEEPAPQPTASAMTIDFEEGGEQ